MDWPDVCWGWLEVEAEWGLCRGSGSPAVVGGEDFVSIWEHWQQQEILLVFRDDISISYFYSYLNNT